MACEDLLDSLDAGDQRNRLVDAWKCDENINVYKSGLEVYWVEITKHPTDTGRILISNFYNVDENVHAEAILSGKKLTLPLQTLTGGFTVTGSGEIETDWNKITWSYSVDDGSGVATPSTAVYTRLE
jgi:hypothetical protein